MAGTSMAFEAEVWSILENDRFDESGGSARIAGLVLNIANYFTLKPKNGWRWPF
jgi:hypothetical protein